MKDVFKHHAAVDITELSRYLEELAQSFSKGCLPLAENDNFFQVCPIGLINLNIKLRRKNGEGRLSIELDWPEEKIPPLPLLDTEQGSE